MGILAKDRSFTILSGFAILPESEVFAAASNPS
jgi:hypothetical protein